MIRAESLEVLRKALDGWREQGQRIAFVPTMGNLHAGHLSLVRAAGERARRVVVSIFVNPLQFDRADDLARYPRTLEDDELALRDAGVDLLFLPDEALMYPQGREDQTLIHVPGLSEMLCGAARPGHFDGVATVVCKLFNLVRPDLALFGEKDYQQLAIIRKMVEDLNLPVEIAGMPTVRESDGLAMSSRNAYLDAGQRARAAAIHRALQQGAAALRAGERDYARLAAMLREGLVSEGLHPDYVEIRRPDLTRPGVEDRAWVILIAAWLGEARLIDNLRVTI